MTTNDSLKPHTSEWYEAYRNREIKVISASDALPGQTEWEPIDAGSAEIIANHFYDVMAIARQEAGYFAVKTRSGWSAIVGKVKGVPAILHKEHGGTSTLNTLTVNW